MGAWAAINQRRLLFVHYGQWQKMNHLISKLRALVTSVVNTVTLAARSNPARIALLVGASASMSFAGTITTGDFTSNANVFVNLFMLIGAVAVIGGLVFAVMGGISGHWGRLVGGILTAIVGGIVVGYAVPWSASLTGYSL